MGGKAAILLVLGFSLIFLFYGHRFNSLSTSSVDNFSDYYVITKAHNIAVSAANMAANELFNDQTWDEGYTDLSFDGGNINVYVSNPLTGTTTTSTSSTTSTWKTKVCHTRGRRIHTLLLPPAAVTAHLTHGDYLGECGSTTPLKPAMIVIVAEGTYQDSMQQIIVELEPSKFSKFAYYSRYEPSYIWWYNKDTVWGPMHTQGNLQAAEKPTFMGKVTIRNRLRYRYNKSRDKPHFYGGFETGVDLPMPTDGVDKLEAAADVGGLKFTGKDTVYVVFAGDSLRYKFAANDTWTTKLGSTATPNGTIFADDAVLRIQGNVKGRYSIGASGSSGGKGDIYLDGDVVYNSDPRTNVNSGDMLGIIAKNNVWITDNPGNNSDINIHGSVYCEQGGFGSENYASRPPSGAINLLGGIIQDTRRAVGTFSYSGIASGFQKKYRYDNRLLTISPPFYPGTDQFEIVSWYE